MTIWTSGDVSGSQTLTDNDHLYPEHINELRVKIDSNSKVFGESVMDYGAVGDGVADDTLALQAALDTGKTVWIPAGSYRYTTALHLGAYNQTIQGAGIYKSILAPEGAINGFEDSLTITQNRCTMRDFMISGDTTTLDAIHFTNLTYMCLFENLWLSCGGRGFYNSSGFSYSIRDCQINSINDHGIEIAGGPAVLIEGCYVHSIGATKAGYKVYSSATLVACNGIDSLSDMWGEFGSTAAGEGVNSQHKVNLIGCNIEHFGLIGLHFKYNGKSSVEGCTFQPYSLGTHHYDCMVYIDYCDALIKLDNNQIFAGSSVRDKLAHVYTPATGYVLSIGASFAEIDIGGVLTDLPCIYVTTGGAGKLQNIT